MCCSTKLCQVHYEFIFLVPACTHPSHRTQLPLPPHLSQHLDAKVERALRANAQIALCTSEYALVLKYHLILLHNKFDTFSNWRLEIYIKYDIVLQMCNKRC